MSTGSKFDFKTISLNYNLNYVILRDTIGREAQMAEILKSNGGKIIDGEMYLIIATANIANITADDILTTASILLPRRDLSGIVTSEQFSNGIDRFVQGINTTLVNSYGTMVTLNISKWDGINNLGWCHFDSNDVLKNGEANLNNPALAGIQQFTLFYPNYFTFVQCLSFDPNIISVEQLARFKNSFRVENVTLSFHLNTGTKFPVVSGNPPVIPQSDDYLSNTSTTIVHGLENYAVNPNQDGGVYFFNPFDVQTYDVTLATKVRISQNTRKAVTNKGIALYGQGVRLSVRKQLRDTIIDGVAYFTINSAPVIVGSTLEFAIYDTIQAINTTFSEGDIITLERYAACNLSELVDYKSSPPPTNGQALTYNSTLFKWEPITLPTFNNKVTKGGDTDGTLLKIGTLDNQPLDIVVNNVIIVRADNTNSKLQTSVGYYAGFYNNETIPNIALTKRLPYFLRSTPTLFIRELNNTGLGLGYGKFEMYDIANNFTNDWTLVTEFQIQLVNYDNINTQYQISTSCARLNGFFHVSQNSVLGGPSVQNTAMYRTNGATSIVGNIFIIPVEYSGGYHPNIAVPNTLESTFTFDRVNPRDLNELMDCSITDTTDGNLLTYNNALARWESHPPATGLSTTLYEYRVDTTSQLTPPAITRMRYNTISQVAATHLYLSHLQFGNIDIELLLALYQVGTKIIVQDKNSSSDFQKFTISAAPVVFASSYVDFEVTYDTSGGTGLTNFADNLQVLTMFIVQSGGGGGGGSVTNVSALTLGTTGVDLTSSVANSSTTPVITLNVPNASATSRGVLNATDWITFNSKPTTIDTQSDVAMSLPIGNGQILTYSTATSKWKNGSNVIGKNDEVVLLRSQGTASTDIQSTGTGNILLTTVGSTNTVNCNTNLYIPSSSATNKLVTATEHTLARQISETAVSKALTTVEYVRSLIPTVAFGAIETAPLQRADTIMTANSWSYYINIRCTGTFAAVNLIYQVLSGSGNVRGAVYTGRVGSGVPVLKAQTGSNLSAIGVHSRVLTAEVGQNLNFTRGSDYVICLSDDGTSTRFTGYSVVVDTNVAGINTTDYSAAGFPVNPPVLTSAGVMPCIQII